jgi:hypothetical protein
MFAVERFVHTYVVHYYVSFRVLTGTYKPRNYENYLFSMQISVNFCRPPTYLLTPDPDRVPTVCAMIDPFQKFSQSKF